MPTAHAKFAFWRASQRLAGLAAAISWTDNVTSQP